MKIPALSPLSAIRQIVVSLNQVIEKLNRPDEYTVATLPPAADYPRAIVYVSDETGGAVLAFSDGADWRRVTDREVVTAAE